jgi:hypothetical protein
MAVVDFSPFPSITLWHCIETFPSGELSDRVVTESVDRPFERSRGE